MLIYLSNVKTLLLHSIKSKQQRYLFVEVDHLIDINYNQATKLQGAFEKKKTLVKYV